MLGTRGDVDLPLAGQRHKVLRNGLSVPPRLTIANLINMAMKPKWCLEMLRTRRRIFGNLVVFDDTLIGAGCRKDDLNMLQAVSPCAVIRESSGIKLLQGGLELANVGIISAYTPDAGQLEAVNIGVDALARTLMYEAAVVILTRLKRASSLKDWGLSLS